MGEESQANETEVDAVSGADRVISLEERLTIEREEFFAKLNSEHRVIGGTVPTGGGLKGASNLLKWSKVMKGKDIVKMLEKIGFKQVGQVGSHVKLKLFGKGSQVIVPVHGSKTIPSGTLKSIQKQVEEAIKNNL